ncbi:MAG: DUF3147 family protein [Candidatus Burarchaeum sp.]|nr:DUF3147 family protein [Candidatus Burarchaeum sp.]MDO8340010.1 DUF3147 family protein [Candidatus Burarchaeum sp.]
MLDPFSVKLLLGFLVGGIWITLATVISERFGSKIGGLVGNLPSNILVGLFFIGMTQSAEFAAEAAGTVPIGMIMDSIFLFSYVVLVKKYDKLAALPALAIWFVMAYAIGKVKYFDLFWTTLAYFAVVLALFAYLEYGMRIPSMKKKKPAYSASELAIRGFLAGGLIVAVTIGAALFGPVWGGIFSVFPVVMLSTMYLLNRAQGPEFAQATGKVMLLGSVNIVVYAFAVIFTYPVYGLVWGTVISYVAAAVFVVLAYPIIKKVS